MDNSAHRPKSSRGVTLVELLIALALIGIGVIVAVKSFTSIGRSIQFSKNRTLATNIAQEKMQIIMQKSYYEVLVTRTASFLAEGSTTIPYDTQYFPPETVKEGGILFTRYTYIEPVMENSGTFLVLPPTTPDTGMRRITQTVVWPTDNGDRFIIIRSVLNNPNTVMANSILQGVVLDSTTLAPIPNAVVNASENIGWQDITDSSGTYLINLSPGTFNFKASVTGYYSRIVPLTMAPYATVTQNFYMVRVSSARVKGTAWINNHPVISQVVASTGTLGNVEYVELYNATTSQIIMGTNAGAATPNVWVVAFDQNNNYHDRQLVYISTYIPTNSYYLITNTGDGVGTVHCDTITVNGINVNPDACWRSIGGVYPNYLHTLQCLDISAGGGCVTGQYASGVGIGTNGGVAWTGLAGVTKYDAIGWTGTGTSIAYETSAAISSSLSGMVLGESFVRRVDTTTAITATYGNAYDSDVSSIDFRNYPASIPITPRTIAASAVPLTGTPASGAIVSVMDGLSVPSTATLTGSPAYAEFSIPSVATGTWSVFIDSGPISAQIDDVTIAGTSQVSIPNATTTPAWTTIGSNTTILNAAGNVGMITGTVVDAGNIALNGITVTAGTFSAASGPTGTYYLRVATGPYSVIANPGNLNATYASVTRNGVNVTLGNVVNNVNFPLSQGGKISGWVSRDGINPVPGISVVALDVNGIARDTQVTGTDGRFLLVNLTTGPYTVQPVLDLKELSSPTTSFASVTAGNTTFSSTFTVTGAMGTVAGNVTLTGQPIKSGVLVLVSTGAVPTPLPAISSNTLTGSSYYAGTSREDGTYSVDVRGSSTTFYTVAAFYMSVSGTTSIISTQTVSNVTISAGLTTSGVNFAW